MNRTDTQIIGTALLREQRFFDIVSGNTDDLIFAEQSTHISRLHIVLTDMNAVCAALQTRLHVIVDDAHYTVSVTQLDNFLCFCDKIFMIQTLFTNLHDGCAALQALLHLFIQGTRADPCAICHCIQQHGIFDCLFSVIEFQRSFLPVMSLRPSS